MFSGMIKGGVIILKTKHFSICQFWCFTVCLCSLEQLIKLGLQLHVYSESLHEHPCLDQDSVFVEDFETVSQLTQSLIMSIMK